MNDRLAGVLLGTAVGDALGLPAEGLSPMRRRRMMPGAWRHRFVLGRGMLSDDTEHALFVAQSLLTCPQNADAFQRCLAWRLRWWFVGLPAGIGLATARACVRLWLGVPAARSGVFSAGNGPAMRSAVIGAYFRDDSRAIDDFVLASTRATHTDPRAATAALAVARLAAWAVQHDVSRPPIADFVAEMLFEIAPEDREWCCLVGKIRTALSDGMSVVEFAASLGLQKGITGYSYHTVPIAVFAWMRHYGDFGSTLTAALDCGGDTDTVGAIVGALAGATVGSNGIPDKWLRGIVDWPRSISLLRKVADRLDRQRAEGHALGPVSYPWPAVLPRNVLFLSVVLAHGFRRLLPPY
jgi:ADP-ribosyl-[dinitrogen reductase] hydrolase